MMFKIDIRKIPLLLLSLTILSCGGGGGSSGPDKASLRPADENTKPELYAGGIFELKVNPAEGRTASGYDWQVTPLDGGLTIDDLLSGYQADQDDDDDPSTATFTAPTDATVDATYTITVTIAYNVGNSDKVSLVLTIIEEPVIPGKASLTPADDAAPGLYAGGTLKLEANPAEGRTASGYNWQVAPLDSGLTIDDLLSGYQADQDDNDPSTATFTAPTDATVDATYTITVTIAYNVGNSDKVSLVLTIIEEPVIPGKASLTPADDAAPELYAGGTLKLEANPAEGRTASGYNWQVAPLDSGLTIDDLLSGYQADQDDNDPSTATFTAPTDATVDATYTITVTIAYSDEGDSDKADLELKIIAPTATFSASTEPNAGDDTNYLRNKAITLDASASSSGQSSGLLAFDWKISFIPQQEGETSTAEMVKPDADNHPEQATFTPDLPGTYSVTLTVEIDGATATSQAKTFLVINQAPTVVLTTSTQSLYQKEASTLTATASDDDNDTLTYTWQVGRQNPGETGFTSVTDTNALLSDYDQNNDPNTVTFTAPEDAEIGSIYQISVTAHDGYDDDQSADESKQVELTIIDGIKTEFTATEPNADDTNYLRNKQITLDASNSRAEASSSNNTDGLTFAWELTTPGGSTATLQTTTPAQVTFTPDLLGTYSVKLTATRTSDGKTRPFTKDFTVINQNPNPVAITDGNGNTIADTITLYRGSNAYALWARDKDNLAEGPSDPDGDTLTYEWQIGLQNPGETGFTNVTDINTLLSGQEDGDPSTVTFTAPTDATVGDTYRITVTAKDQHDGSALSEPITITIGNQVPNTFVITDDDGNPITATQELHQGNVLALKASSSDPDGDDATLTYTWQVALKEPSETEFSTIDENDQLQLYKLLLGLDTDKDDDPSTVTFNAPTDATSEAQYQITATATDSDGGSTPSNTITITITNQDPTAPEIALAGQQTALYRGDIRTLSITTESTDDDNDTLTYEWQIGLQNPGETEFTSVTDINTLLSGQEDGDPNTVTFTAPTDATVGGKYSITVTAKDAHGGSTPSNPITLTIGNQAPNPVAITDGNGNTIAATITLYRGSAYPLLVRDAADPTQAAASDDDGDTLTYEWQIGLQNPGETEFTSVTDINTLLSGQEDDPSTVTFTAPTDATVGDIYRITVTAKDQHDGSAQSDPITITIQALTISAVIDDTTAGDQRSLHQTKSLALKASASRSDGDDATLLTYTWQIKRQNPGETGFTGVTDTSALLSGYDQDNEPNTVTFIAPDDAETGAQYEIIATTGDGDDRIDSNTITITISNQAPDPIVVEITDENGNVITGTSPYRGTTYNLKARDSSNQEHSDGDRDTLTYEWLVTRNDIDSSNSVITPVSSGSRTDAHVLFIVPDLAKAGWQYLLTVTAKDNYGGSSQPSATIILTIGNQAPTAPEITLAAQQEAALYRGDTRTLSITSESTDADRDTLIYAWQVMQGSLDVTTNVLSFSGALSARFTAPTDATVGDTYRITVAAMDGTDTTPSNEITLTIGNSSPSVFIATDRETLYATVTNDDGTTSSDPVTLTAHASDLEDDADPQKTLAYRWQVNDGDGDSSNNITLVEAASVSFSPPATATTQYSITVTVTDSGGAETTADAIILSFVTDNTPIAAFTISQDNAPTDGTYHLGEITLDASNSRAGRTVADNSGLSFAWTVTAPDGNSQELTAVELTAFDAQQLGEYNVELTISYVTPTETKAVAISRSFTVINRAPSISIYKGRAQDGATQVWTYYNPLSEEWTYPGGRTRFALKAVDDDAADEENLDKMLTYTWQVLEESDNGIAIRNDLSVRDENKGMVIFTAPTNAQSGNTYRIFVTVTDKHGKESPPASLLLTVIAQPKASITQEGARLSYTFSGASSEGKDLVYRWALKDLADPTTLLTDATFTIPGAPNSNTLDSTYYRDNLSDGEIYFVTLTVTDVLQTSHTAYYEFFKGDTHPLDDNNSADKPVTTPGIVDGDQQIVKSGIITVDPSGLQQGRSQHLMVQTHDPHDTRKGRVVFSKWEVSDPRCGAFANGGLFSGTVFSLLTIPDYAAEGYTPPVTECVITVTISDLPISEDDEYGRQQEQSQTFAVPRLPTNEPTFAYYDEDILERSFTLPEKSASYTVPANFYREDEQPIHKADTLKVPAGWQVSCAPDCDESSSDNIPIIPAPAEQVKFHDDVRKIVTLTKGAVTITLTLQEKYSKAIAILGKEDFRWIKNKEGAQYENKTPPLESNYYQLTTIDMGGNIHLPADKDQSSGDTYFSFVPVGQKADGTDETDQGEKAFKGQYDGQNLPLRNLRMHRRNDVDNALLASYAGLFGYTQESSIKNVALQGVDVLGNAKIGALIGVNVGGNISNSYAIGIVGNQYGLSGGLVGRNINKADSSEGKISNSYAKGYIYSILQESPKLGGLVGENSGIIENSYASGTVQNHSGETTGITGGLVGENSGTIENSYAHSKVIGHNKLGGLVGENKASISNSYALGNIISESSRGGLVGTDNSGTIISSYWDSDVSGDISSTNGEALSTDNMKLQDSYTDWVFTGENRIWGISNTVNYGYPYLLCISGQDGYLGACTTP